MNCKCANIACIELLVSPCDATVNTTLVANAAGDWKAVIEFNGVYTQQIKTFANNNPIVLDNTFNGNYKHHVEIYKPDGTLFNDTCYVFSIKTLLDGQTPPSPSDGYTVTKDATFIIVTDPNPATGNGTPESPYQLAPGNTITIPWIAGKTIHVPVYYNEVPEYTPYNSLTGTFDRTANGGFLVNDIITISYEKPV